MNQENSTRFIIFCSSFYLSIILLACFATPTPGGTKGGNFNGISLDHTFDGSDSIFDCNKFESLDHQRKLQHTNFGSTGIWNPNYIQGPHNSEIKDIEPHVSSLKRSRLGKNEDHLKESTQDEIILQIDDRSIENLYQQYSSISEPESSTRKKKAIPYSNPEKVILSQISLHEAGLYSGSSYPQENTMELGMAHSNFLDNLNGRNMEDQIQFTPRIQKYSERLLTRMTNSGILKFKHPLRGYIVSTLAKNYEDLELKDKTLCHKVKYSEMFSNIPVVKLDNIARPLEKSTKRYLRKEVFIPRMETLINWILLIHTSTQMEIFPKMSEEEKMESCKEIIDWIINETFFTHSSVPVFGVIHKKDYSMNESAFQEVQLILIRYLSEKHSSKLCLSNSIALIKIWNRKPSNAIQSSSIHLLDNEETSEFFLSNTIANFLQVVRTYKEKLQSMLPKQIQGFHQYLPQTVIPRGFPFVDDQKLDPDSNKIIEEIEKLYKSDKIEKEKYHSKTLPVYVVSDEKFSPFKSIKISCREKKRIPHTTMISRSKSLLIYLIICQNAIIKYSLLGVEIYNKDLLEQSNANLMKIVYKEFFNPEKGTPIFGNIFSEEMPLETSQFGDIQILCIYYFSRPRSYMMLPSILIKFMGLWIKKFLPEKWNELFSEDQDKFSKYIIDFLVINEKRISDAFEKNPIGDMNKKQRINQLGHFIVPPHLRFI